MAKILFITQRYHPAVGGAESYVKTLAEWRVKQGDSVDVWTSDAIDADALWFPKREKTKEKESVIEGARVRRFESSPLFLNSVFLSKSFRYILWHLPNWQSQCIGSPPTCLGMVAQTFKKDLPEYDIIHVSAMPYNSLMYVGMRLAKKTGAKLYITPFQHSNVKSKYVLEDKYYHPRILPFYAAADKVFVQTESERKGLISFFDQYRGLKRYSDLVKVGYASASQISESTPEVLLWSANLFIWIMSTFMNLWGILTSVFPKRPQFGEIDSKKLVKVGLGLFPKEFSGGDGARFRKKHGISSDEKVVFYIGAKAFVKGVRGLVLSMEKLWKEGKKAKLVLAGGMTVEFEDFWKKQEDLVKKNTTILDRIDEEEKQDLFAAGDIFSMVSTSESFGIVYLEAWMYGKPVIGSNIEVIKETISDGKDGYTVEFDNIEEISGKIGKLLEDDKLRESMGEAGYRKVMDGYTWDKKFKILEKYFNG